VELADSSVAAEGCEEVAAAVHIHDLPVVDLVCSWFFPYVLGPQTRILTSKSIL